MQLDFCELQTHINNYLPDNHADNAQNARHIKFKTYFSKSDLTAAVEGYNIIALNMML